jgi:hypothetical protein
MSDPAAVQCLSDRAARFARHIAGEAEPNFADWQRRRQIDRMVAARRGEIARLVALLDARAAIDRDLNGSRLSALAACVGEAQFDRVCEAGIAWDLYQRGCSKLPDPHLLQDLGEALLQSFVRSADALELANIAVAIDTACVQPEVAA